MYNYRFLCDCPRCVNDPSCPSQLDLTPPIIQVHLSDTQKDEKLDFLEQLYHESENQYSTEYMSGDNKHFESIKMANKWLNNAKEFYAPLHPHVFKITEFLGRVYAESGEYKKALKYFEKTVQIMDMVFPEFWFRKWDVWIAILLNNHFDNKWDDLINHLYKNHWHYNRNNCESMIVQIEYLRDELSDKGLNPTDIIIGLDDDFLKKQEINAKRKVIELSFQDKEKSKSMHNTPRNIFFEEALQGNWDILPVNPQKQAEALRKKFKKKTHYSKGQTHALEEKLDSYIEKQEIKATLPKLFALYRAFLTVSLENMDNIDDSYGVIGDLSISVFEKYLELDWRQLSIDANGYFTDIVKYVIWEDYGVTDEVYPAMFSKLTKSEIKEIDLLLQTEREKLIKHHLTYQAENALTILGSLYAKNYLFNKFIPVAKEMGTREWKRILILSEAAEKKKEYKIALSVFDVAIKESGYHIEYLRKEYSKLKARINKKS